MNLTVHLFGSGLVLSLLLTAPGARAQDARASEERVREALASLVPMPPPKAAGELVRKPASSAGAPVVYDLRRREERLVGKDAGVPSRLPTTLFLPERPGIDGGAARPAAKDFEPLVRIPDPTVGDYKKHVLLILVFDGVNYACSGTLIDARHVLTAGHCVHQGGGGNWAEEVYVIPAYSENSLPFGFATNASLLSFEGWTVDGDLMYDVGMVEIGRPVGALTGWRGLGTSNDESYFLTGTWELPGYPGEDPYDGKQMYTWTGFYDTCGGFLFGLFETRCGYSRLSYHGQSGSGAIKDGVAWAVHSHYLLGLTYDVTVTAGEFDAIVSVIDDHTSPAPDLVPLGVQATPGTVLGGSALGSLSYVVYNNSLAPVSGTFTVHVYASADDVVTAGDTLLGTHTFTHAFTSREAFVVNVPVSPVIPVELSGEIWIGVVLDTADADESNNATSGADAFKLQVEDDSSIFADGFESGVLSAWSSWSP